jgi:hypothetical protein
MVFGMQMSVAAERDMAAVEEWKGDRGVRGSIVARKRDRRPVFDFTQRAHTQSSPFFTAH